MTRAPASADRSAPGRRDADADADRAPLHDGSGASRDDAAPPRHPRWLGAGIRAIPSTDTTALELTTDAPSPGLADITALADFALGGALRRRLGAGRRLPTLTLTIELGDGQMTGATSVRAWSAPVTSDLARAHGVVLGGDRRTGKHHVGQCAATFVVPQQGADLGALPWDKPASTPPGDPVAVWSAETAITRACSAHGDTITMVPDETMLNRSGFVQDAALFRLAASAPQRFAQLVSSHVQFHRPADHRSPLTAELFVVTETRRVVFVRCVVQQREVAVATSSSVFIKEGCSRDRIE